MTIRNLWNRLINIFDLNTILSTALKIVLVIIAAIFVYYIVKYLIRRIFSFTLKPKSFRLTNEISLKKRQKTIEKIMLSIWQYSVWVLAVLLILSTLGINIQTILAGAGIVGVIFAVGSQRLIQDFLDGFFNIFEDNISVGDYVIIDGVEGTIVDIRLRDIKIKSWTGEMHIIPNSKIGHLINFSLDHGKAIVDIKVSYDANPSHVIKVLESELERLKDGNRNILTTPKILGVNHLDELGYEIRITCETVQETHWSVQRYLRKEILMLFQEKQIPIGLNQIRIYEDSFRALEVDDEH